MGETYPRKHEHGPLSPLSDELMHRASEIMNPDIRREFDEQLVFLQDFWRSFGYEMPILSAEDQAKMAETLGNRTASERLFAYHLKTIDGLSSWIEDSKVVIPMGSEEAPRNQLSLDQPGLRLSSLSSRFMKLQAEAEGRAGDAVGANVELVQKVTQAGFSLPGVKYELVPKQLFGEEMVRRGQAIRDDHGDIWLFPIVNIANPDKDAVNQPKSRFNKIDPTLTREAVVLLILLQMAAGNKIEHHSVDMLNEFVYSMARGEYTPPQTVACIRWLDHTRQIQFYESSIEDSANYDVRLARTGLKP